jgi:hypothetical protein
VCAQLRYSSAILPPLRRRYLPPGSVFGRSFDHVDVAVEGELSMDLVWSKVVPERELPAFVSIVAVAASACFSAASCSAAVAAWRAASRRRFASNIASRTPATLSVGGDGIRILAAGPIRSYAAYARRTAAPMFAAVPVDGVGVVAPLASIIDAAHSVAANNFFMVSPSLGECTPTCQRSARLGKI